MIFEYCDYDLKKYMDVQGGLTDDEVQLFTKQMIEGECPSEVLEGLWSLIRQF